MNLIARLAILAALFATVPALQAQREKFTQEELAIIKKQWPTTKRTATGLHYVITKEGEGPTAKAGDMVSVIYRGSILGGGIFDEDLNREHPFTFRLGRSLVIQGWDQGLKLMKKGTKITLIVPADLAYGTRGDPPKIGPRAALVFEVEMIDLKSDAPPAPPPAAAAPKKK